ncbi:MAG: MoxR family ATPase [Pirellula sp.]|nr:MoxR family ATPase [Pirellula sp.]
MSQTNTKELAIKVAGLRGAIQEQLGSIVVGQSKVIDQMFMALLANGHVLLEGVPGTAKTTLCRSFSIALGLQFERIQFTPDLLPSDVTGTQVLDRQSSSFVLRKGPIFCQLLLADELNRAPARTQSSLLEAMQERQVTIEGNTLALPNPFLVLATQNPIEQEGVYRLPEAQLDRFLFKIHVGYPGRDEEISMLQLHSKPIASAKPICDAQGILEIQNGVENIYCANEIYEYIIDLVRKSRSHADLLLGASPRAAISLLKGARVHALLAGRDFVTHDDVQSILGPVLGHRLIMKPESEMDGETIDRVIASLTKSIPVVAQAKR